MNVTVKVFAERTVAGDQLLVYVGPAPERLELAGILWVNHETSAEIVSRLEDRDKEQQP